MSKRPTGSSLDEERLLALRAAPESTAAFESSASTLAVEVTPLFEHMGLSPGEDADINWETDERDGLPALVFGPVHGDDVSQAAYPRRLREDADDEVLAPVPDTLVTAEPPEGLGLDVETYDDANPLLFEGIALEDAAALVPARYGDGTPYSQEPRSDEVVESDPVAEATLEHEVEGHPAPNPETLDAPIDPEIVRDAIREFDAPYPDVSAVLEELHRRGVVSGADTVSDHPPLTVDERAVCVVPAGTWDEELPSRLESDPASDEDAHRETGGSQDSGTSRNGDAGSLSPLGAARRIHERQAERLIEEAGAEAYRDAVGEYEVVVTDERETAEWQVADPGTNR